MRTIVGSPVLRNRSTFSVNSARANRATVKNTVEEPRRLLRWCRNKEGTQCKRYLHACTSVVTNRYETGHILKRCEKWQADSSIAEMALETVAGREAASARLMSSQ